MTAVKSVTQLGVASDFVQQIPVEQLFLSPEETRRTIDQAALAELAKSIEKDGVIEALLVRPGVNNKKLRKPGEIIQVCVQPKCKAHRKAWEKAKDSGSNGHGDEAARKAEAERRIAASRAESEIRVAVASEAILAVDKIPAEALRDVALHSVPRYEGMVKLFDAVMPGWQKALRALPVTSGEFAKALALVSIDELAANEYSKPEAGRQQFLASIKRLGYDGARAWKQTAAKATPKAAAKKAAPKKAANPPGRRQLSLEAKEKIVVVMKKRWADAKELALKKAGKKTPAKKAARK